MSDPRDRFIFEVAKGRSFADIGGLSMANTERVSVARAAGATELALVDVEGPSCPWWDQVRVRLASMGIDDCQFISGDIMSVELPPFDVVFSSGVLYHLPSPITYLSRLREIVREYCILTSTTVPTKLSVGDESLSIPKGGALFVPGLSGREKAIVDSWYAARGRANVTWAEPDFGGHSNLRNYYANWFLPTTDAFRAMAVSAGFVIVDEANVEPGELSHCLLLRPLTR